MSLKMINVKTESDKRKLANLASTIWNEYWPALIGQEQTDYMVASFQSFDAINRDMAENAYEYWFLVDEDGNTVGYTGGHPEDETNRYFISKIYLLAHERGKHYATEVINFYNDLCKERGYHAMYLTVNKRNDLGTRAYRAKGFETIEEVEMDIGEGFIMDDYIMERQVV